MRKLLLAVLTLSISLTAVASANHLGTPPQPSCDPLKPKCVQECTGHETVGRCADKCPEPTSQGTYYLMGHGKYGEAICGFSYYNQCPHANVDLHSALCRKLREQHTEAQATPEPVLEELNQDYGGK